MVRSGTQEWLEKLKLVCKLRGVDDVASVIPERLTGGAFAVYLQLAKWDKRLASLFGGISDKAPASAFVAVLPEDVRQLLRIGSRMEDLDLNQVLARVRAVIRDDSPIESSSSEACLGTIADHGAAPRLAAASQRVFGKRARRGDISASLLSWRSVSEVLPSAMVSVEGVHRRVLVDTGCSRSIVHVSCCRVWTKGAIDMVTVSEEKWQCEGTEKPKICVVANTVVGVDEPDFSATYDPLSICWTSARKWSEGKKPGVLRNTVEAYSAPPEARDLYEEELQKWIDDVWLLPYGPVKGLIPLMAVVQRNKKKVRPVMDFRELNAHIDTFTADSDVCSDRLREWQRQWENVLCD
ncbi:hypothetical protein O3P69_012045 [Scylla paramamosain]|uniref:Peptidase A2 domain-containing protein n=1 Tax=Scylla paramamosain TaxID=85552 RepID=A0AAW0SIA3_SCYPA